MPERIQLSRKKGFKLPPNTSKVDRSTKWGNPFRELKGQRWRAVELFRHQLDRDGAYFWKSLVTIDDIKRELKGKNLACWCPVDGSAPCHADVLLKIANEGTL